MCLCFSNNAHRILIQRKRKYSIFFPVSLRLGALVLFKMCRTSSNITLQFTFDVDVFSPLLFKSDNFLFRVLQRAPHTLHCVWPGFHLAWLPLCLGLVLSYILFIYLFYYFYYYFFLLNRERPRHLHQPRSAA